MLLDVVFAWVDKNDPALREKFERWFRDDAPEITMSRAYRPDDSAELEIAVQRVIRYGKGIGKIFIVVDDQDPFARFPSLNEFRNRITVIDHVDIFPEYGKDLPCFDSNAIECHFWRIPGLSDFFLYCNDDFFFMDDVRYKDLVTDTGKMILDLDPFDWTSRLDNPKLLQRHQNLINTIRMYNKKFEPRPFYLARHYPYMYSKSVFEEMFRIFPDEMRVVSSSRFRSDDYILPLGLHHHLAIELDIGVKNFRDRGLVIYNEAETKRGTPKKYYDEYRAGALFLCLNNWSSVARHYPEITADVLDRS